MLQSLELFGFKSFAERTSFQFAAGLTAVVGPNGSGKSNVVDGIKWILGDQSPKSLRGKEMTDVIFNGATGRKPAGFAEATLTFDNTTGFLPTPDKEVRVGRRLFRNGDSEYLIGGQVVRLKDIRDLFLGTGAGASAYAIIEQGRVDQILQANASGRRAVFEEAAGISRFKARRAEALKRLERVEQNLLRLTDIVAEAHSQLGTTRAQAAKAAKFRDASQELEGWWLGLAADEYRQSAAAREGLSRTAAERQTELDAVIAEQSRLDERLSELDAEVDAADEAARRAETRASAARERIAGHEATVRFQTARLEELDGDLTRLRRQVTVMALRSSEATAEREHNLRVIARSEADLAARAASLSGSDAEIAALAGDVEKHRRQIGRDRHAHLERLRQVSDVENRIGNANAERESIETATETAAGRLTGLDERLAETEAAVAEARSAAESAEAAARARRAAVDDAFTAPRVARRRAGTTRRRPGRPPRAKKLAARPPGGA